MTGVFDRGCERAQAWASLELDGELSQLERALLETHIRGCAACAETVAGIRTLTHALRNAPLEPLDRPVAAITAARSRRARPLAVRLALAAALAAVAAGLGVVAGNLGSPSPAPPQAPDEPLALLPDAKRDLQGVRPGTREPRDDVGLGSSQLLGGV